MSVNGKEISEAIKQFKKENGNDAYTTKDLLIYIMNKLDSIDEKFDDLPCESHFGFMSEMKGTLRTIKWVVGIAVVLGVPILTVLINQLI